MIVSVWIGMVPLSGEWTTEASTIPLLKWVLFGTGQYISSLALSQRDSSSSLSLSEEITKVKLLDLFIRLKKMIFYGI